MLPFSKASQSVSSATKHKQKATGSNVLSTACRRSRGLRLGRWPGRRRRWLGLGPHGRAVLLVALAATALATTINAVAGFTATANAAVVTVTSTTGEAVELAITAGSAATFTEVTSAYGDVSFTNITNQAVDIYSADAVTASLKDASGTADSLSINLKTLSADKGFNQTIGTVTANLIETINLSSTGMTDGKVKTVSSLAASGIKTLNITGESDLTISGFGTQVAAIDGSAASGDLNLTVSTKDQSIKTGSGNDTIIMAGTLTAADTIDGGANNAIAGGTTVGKDLLTATGNIGTVTTPAALHLSEVAPIANTGVPTNNRSATCISPSVVIPVAWFEVAVTVPRAKVAQVPVLKIFI